MKKAVNVYSNENYVIGRSNEKYHYVSKDPISDLMRDFKKNGKTILSYRFILLTHAHRHPSVLLLSNEYGLSLYEVSF